ncbi:MAG: tungsten ABC transporter substrate-binding protein, partial [Alphaproteobacteria bacterium]
MTRILLAVWLAVAAAVLPGPAPAAETIRLAATTSVVNSGLLAAILPQFTMETGIEVHVLALGTGQALD